MTLSVCGSNVWIMVSSIDEEAARSGAPRDPLATSGTSRTAGGTSQARSKAGATTASKGTGRRSDRAGWRCTACGWSSLKWVGRCGQCQEWGTVTEVASSGTARTAAAHVTTPAQPITSVDTTPAGGRSTGVPEFDRVLGGGLVSDAVVLLAGEPGIGKSTLSLDVAGRAARGGATVLYISGEESAAQVAARARRIGADHSNLLLAAETDLATVLGHIEASSPRLVVIDSVQTVASGEVDGTPGNVGQVKEVAAALVQASKAGGYATILVGHVTKEGNIAGPRVLEHLVDVVLDFEGERGSRLRLIRAVKNRFGPTDEVGCFDLSETGIEGVADPSGLFLSSRDVTVPGTAVSVTLEGRRPLVAEVQALLTLTKAPSPRRTTSGLDTSRAAMILAVLERHGRVPLSNCDTYLSTVGGMRITEPAADLSVAIAVTGSVVDRPIAPGLVCLGEVGLAGEVRRVSGVERRLTEAARLGFTHALVPRGTLDDSQIPAGMHVARVDTVRDAIDLALGLPAGTSEEITGAGPSPEPAVTSRSGGVEAHPERATHPSVRGGRRRPVSEPQPLVDVPGVTDIASHRARRKTSGGPRR